MRIALVTDTYRPQVNGVTTVVARIVSALGEAGHAAAVVAPRYPGGERPPGDDGSGGRELRVPSVPFPPYPAIRLSFPLFSAVARFLDAFRPEVIHVATEGPLGLTGRRYAVRHGVPLVTSYHTNFPQYARHYGAGVIEPLVWRWLRWFHAPARLTQTPGETVRDVLARRRIGRPVVWGRGVDTRTFRPNLRDIGWRRWLAGGDEAAIVLHVGRLASEKNLKVLIDAWRLARQTLRQRATFVVAGDGPWGRRLDAELPFIRRLGFLPPTDLARLYASADICVLPSHTETCGLVALEAMASGLAVVAADAGGFRESIADGVTGLLVPAHDPAEFAEAIGALVAQPRWRRELGAAARDAALDRDVAAENRDLLAQYAAVAGTGASPGEPGVVTCAA